MKQKKKFMKTNKYLLFIIFFLSAFLFYGCGNNHQKDLKHFTTEDAINIFSDNKQVFLNVQKAFNVEDIKNNSNFFTRENYINKNLSDEQNKAIKDIFEVPEVKNVNFNVYKDSHKNYEQVYELKFILERNKYKDIRTISFNPPNSSDILASRPDTNLEGLWFVFKPASEF